MQNMSHFCDDCVLLPGEKILHKFKAGEFPDKTFSKLYARWLHIVTLPGFVIEVHKKKIDTCYCITPEHDDFPVHTDTYCVMYDFRAQFETLEQWMGMKKVRPGPVFCNRKNLEPHIEKSLEKGYNFASDFLLIVSLATPGYPSILSTFSQQSLFIEYSKNSDVAHGSEHAELCIVQGDTPVRNDPGLPHHVLTAVAAATRTFTELIGENTTCEFLVLDNVLCLLAAQKSSIMRIPLSGCSPVDVKVVAPGSIQGTIKQVDKASLPDTVKTLSKTNQKHVFIAEKPYSEFADILNYAEGFIFDKGSMLCHLAILLREMGIPARIINDTTSTYKDGDTISLE
jgi:phosphohistidine swiveling domain-containing protein